MLAEINFFISLQNENKFLVQWSFEITGSNILVKNLATLQLYSLMDETIGVLGLGLPHKLAGCELL